MAHTLIGTVTSDKRDKTITVSIVSRETHPLYRKQYSKTRKYTAHDPKNIAHVGDRVQIEMTRPISKTKSYTLVKVLEKSRGTVELKEGVTEVVQEKKIGADEIAREKALAEETEAKAETSASKITEKDDETDAEGEDK
ncbi:30S ribosomal protein S17 [Candidatus Saccharibacteria bacterium]|nr:30S ribosomal protein S17 [Candidatus Saccharibacteria bacterium]